MLLVVVTIGSLLVAVITSVIAWRLARDARERSLARVAALGADIDGDDAMTGALPLAWSDVPGITEPAAGPGRAAAHGLFGAGAGDQDRSTVGRLAPAVLAGVLIVGGVLATAVMVSGGGKAATAAAHGTRPLELLSLRHDLKDGAMTITGLIRNPAGNGGMPRITAVVFLFDDKGGFLASGRAGVDFPLLAAGDESPFVVSLTAPPGVARYRVSFRRDEGGIIPHVDRRDSRQP